MLKLLLPVQDVRTPPLSAAASQVSHRSVCSPSFSLHPLSQPLQSPPFWNQSGKSHQSFMAKPRGLVYTCWASLLHWLSPVSWSSEPTLSPVPSPSLPIAMCRASTSSSSLEMSLLPRLFVQPSLLSNAHRPFGIPKEN